MYWPVRKATYKTGLWAEFFAVGLLRVKGYKILDRRYKTPYGEIDIIALKGRSLHFIEVKRRQKSEDALYAISNYQRRRIENAAQAYLSRWNGRDIKDIHFDAVIVYNTLAIRHVMSAWRSGDTL